MGGKKSYRMHALFYTPLFYAPYQFILLLNLLSPIFALGYCIHVNLYFPLRKYNFYICPLQEHQ
jgi:hypothetical protein